MVVGGAATRSFLLAASHRSRDTRATSTLLPRSSIVSMRIVQDLSSVGTVHVQDPGILTVFRRAKVSKSLSFVDIETLRCDLTYRRETTSGKLEFSQDEKKRTKPEDRKF